LTYPFEPTLCYQLSFPRTNKIRWFWLVKRVCEYLIANGLILFLFGQYMVPILERAAVIYIRDGVTLELVGRLLKMSVPSVLAWILNFFAGFQAMCNVLAEITYFADRQFYLVLFLRITNNVFRNGGTLELSRSTGNTGICQCTTSF
jgi:diacylglycerol O-acyltransferase-1